MKVSYQWLSQYVDLSGYTAQQLAELLTRSGIEVDSVTARNAGVTGVVVGYVASREKHPNADKLSVCQVDVGTGELLQIVCGAANVAAGQKVPVATVGAVLPGDFRIKKAKLRDVESHGMICSAKELGLNEKLLPKEQQEGILVLPEEATLGEEITSFFALNDEVMELDLTPNRSDCLSMIGVAYEIGSIIGRPVQIPDATALVETFVSNQNAVAAKVSINIEATEDCSLYSGRLIEGVKVTNSPQWLQNRLLAAGIRPINNVVDVTNYVLLEYGQPLHAFDRNRLDSTITVRFARAAELLETLDGQERTLQSSMLVIADGQRAIALAGVMGGANSEVSAQTTSIFLESAKFAGPTVRKTSRQLGLRSESSLRFEKEVNPDGVMAALDRAAALIAELAGGQVVGEKMVAQTQLFTPQQIAISLEKINSYLGTSLTVDEVHAIFARLQFEVQYNNGVFAVTVPHRRGDITIDVDLIEEIARLYGYDNIPTSLVFGDTTVGALSHEQRVRREVRRRLVGFGLDEVINYTFTEPQRATHVPGFYEGKPMVPLAMPMSEERSVLRQSLVPHLLDMAAYNRDHHQHQLGVFEIGQVFVTDEQTLQNLPQEPLHLGIMIAGQWESEQWNHKPRPVDFYDVKGIIERLLASFGVSDVYYRAYQGTGYHPGRSASIELNREGKSHTIGVFGQLHPETQQTLELSDTYIAELDLDALISFVDTDIQYQALAKYPESKRDLALVVARDVESGKLLDTIRQAGGELLKSVQVFDVYTGERIDADKKSVAFSLTFRHDDRTLQDEEVQNLVQHILQALADQCSAQLRQ